MTRKEHLLTILSEECAEVSQRASKALRFGVSEVQPEQPLNNAQRIVEEFNDLFAVVEMLKNEGVLNEKELITRESIDAKQQKVEKFLKLSLRQGTLCDS